MFCPQDPDGDRAAAYVARRLSSGEQDAFEMHLLTCERCQEVVRLGQAVRAARRRPAVRHLAWGLAAAATLAAVAILPRSNPWRDLAAAPPPVFVGATARAAPARAAADSGMDAYLTGNWRRAARLLAGASDSATEPGLAFFAGAAEFLAGRPRPALALLRVVAGGTSPYAAEAQVLAAKAWLAQAEPDSALAALRPPKTPHAAALADSIRARR